MVSCIIDVLQSLPHDAAHGLITPADVALRHFKQLGFGFIQQIQNIGGLFEGLLGDQIGNPNQFALNVFLGNDPRMGFNVRSTRHPQRQLSHRLRPSYLLQISCLSEGLGDGQNVHRLRGMEQIHNRRVNPTVGVPVKTLRLENIDDRVHGRLLHHHGTQHRFLQVQRLGLYFA